MNRSKDLVINVAAPLITGSLLYIAGIYFTLPLLVKNYGADSLWAYAFISCILIVWNRVINPLWISAVFITAVVFEALQYFHIVSGTGDWADVVVYFFSFTIALLINLLIKRLYQNKK